MAHSVLMEAHAAKILLMDMAVVLVATLTVVLMDCIAVLTATVSVVLMDCIAVLMVTNAMEVLIV